MEATQGSRETVFPSGAYGFLRTWVIFLASCHKQSPWSGRELDLLTTGLLRGHLWGDQSWTIQQQPLAKPDLVNSGSGEDSGPCVRVRVAVGAGWVKGLFHPRIFGDCGLGPKEGWKFTSLFLFLFLLLFLSFLEIWKLARPYLFQLGKVYSLWMHPDDFINHRARTGVICCGISGALRLQAKWKRSHSLPLAASPFSSWTPSPW